MKSEFSLKLSVWSKLILILGVFLLPTEGFAMDESDFPVKLWLGAGGVFYEADEANESGQLYELRAGYDLNPRFTLEAGLGGAPFLEGNDFGAPDPREATFNGKNSPGENWFLKPNFNVLYHFQEDKESQWDPYASVGGGAMYYGKRRDDSNWEAYAGLGGGLAYAINDAWTVRGDYQAVVAGEDSQINHHALLFFRYVWGEGPFGHGSGKGGELGGPSTGPLQAIYFDFDSSTLTPPSKSKLKENAAWLQENPKTDVSLEGHCDERGTNEYNMALGERRASSAYEYLRSLGVPEEQMSRMSFGEELPADPGHTEESWSKNRRVESVAK